MGKLEEIIAKVSAYMGRMEEEAKEQYNFKELTLTQMHYLEMISERENPNLTELAAAMKLTKPTITVLVDKLIEKELVYKVQSDADRRNTHLHLTERGKLINQMHEYAHRRMAEEIEKKIDTDEMGQLTRLLEKIMK
ncbi:MAG: MarR family transcriptional regulator [Bacteroidia bacterium]|nr:MarR family transcriptional regulator [Bacteroidia bacterium]